MAEITINVMSKIFKDKPIIFKNFWEICNALECTPKDVFSFKESGNKCLK